MAPRKPAAAKEATGLTLEASLPADVQQDPEQEQVEEVTHDPEETVVARVADPAPLDLVVPTHDKLPHYLRDWKETVRLLKAPFHPDDVYFLPQGIDYKANTAVAAAYANTRVYSARMNDVIGHGFWQSEVTKVTIAPFTKITKAKMDYKNKNEDGSLKMLTPQTETSAHKITMVVRAGIWMGPQLGWVWHDSTGGKDTADENWDTSAEAQAFKRALVKWGPGEYFYSFGKQSYGYNNKTGQWTQQPRIPDWAYPANFCNDCGEQIVTITYTDPNNITQSMHAWDVYTRSMTMFGIPVCPKCSKARRTAAITPEAEQRLSEQAA